MTDAEGLRTSVWRDRDFLPLWRSQTVSETGSHITVLALPLVAVVLLDSSVVGQQVLRLRREHRIGPVLLAARCGIAASTAHRALVRHHLPALSTLPVTRANLYAATNVPGPANWSTSTSRISAAHPTAAATRSSAAQPAGPTRTAPTAPDTPAEQHA